MPAGAQLIRIPGRRAEALDCKVYAFAARQLVNINPEVRRDDLSCAEPVVTSEWIGGCSGGSGAQGGQRLRHALFGAGMAK